MTQKVPDQWPRMKLPRNSTEANQAMRVHGDDRKSQLAACVAAAPHFMLSAEEAELSEVDKSFMWRRQFLSAYAFWGGGDAIAAMEPGASPRKR